MSATRRLALLAAILLLGTLVACTDAADLMREDGRSDAAAPDTRAPTSPDDPDDSTEEDGPGVERAPELGACRRLEPEDVPPQTNSSAVVPCRSPHTTETFYVGRWPQVVVDEASGVDDRGLERIVARRCTGSLRETLGGGVQEWRTTLVSWAWFTPSDEDFEAGANWFRCDAIAGGPAFGRLEPLPPRIDGLLERLTDRYRVCWSGGLTTVLIGPDQGGPVSCARPHQLRAIAAIRLGERSAEYPGAEVVERLSDERCSERVRAYLDNPLEYDWEDSWPSRANWTAGQRYSICWAVTTE